MLRWLLALVALCAVAFAAVAVAAGKWPHVVFFNMFGPEAPGATGGTDPAIGVTRADQDRDQNIVLTLDSNNGPNNFNSAESVDLPGGRIAATDVQDAPAERDGGLSFVAAELLPSDEKLREKIREIEQDPQLKDPKKRRIKLAEMGLVEEKLTYLAVQIPDDQVKAYADLQDGLNFQFKGDPHTYRRWMEDRSPPPLLADTTVVYTQVEVMKKLQVGDRVVKGQRLAMVKPDLAVADMDVKLSKLKGAEADRVASQKTLEEFVRRRDAYRKNPLGITPEDMRAAELQVNRYTQEETQKRAAIEQAKSELKSALTTLRLHDVRARISGVVRTIYKNPGDSVKNLEAVLRIENPDSVRIECRAELQESRKLHPGMRVIIEATRPDSPILVLPGHMQEIHGVAVCAGRASLPPAARRPVIISGSEDKKLCLWDPNGTKQWEIKYASGVRAVACTPPEVGHRYIAAGTADGAVRLLDLDRIEDKAVLGRFCANVLGVNSQDFSKIVGDNATVLYDVSIDANAQRAHSAAVTCVAFSPDGKIVATGSEDYTIALWDVSSGNLLARLPKAHKQAVTSVQIVKSVNDQGQPVMRMISAGRDNIVALWTLNDGKSPTHDRDFDQRSGDVAKLTSDGKRFLFDQGKDLRLISLANEQLDGMLQNPPTAGSFTTLAVFSPDGETIMTNGTGDTGLQLWRAPDNGGRGSEVRQFVWSGGHATCAAFSPDGSFVVTGTSEDHQVLVWKMPSKEEVQTPLYGQISLVEETVEQGSKLVRVWADLKTKPEWLLPGTKARMVIDPSAMIPPVTPTVPPAAPSPSVP